MRTAKRRPLYQLHLSTLLVQVFALGLFLHLQLTPTKVLLPATHLEAAELRGWPEVFIITHTDWTPNTEDHFTGPKRRNILLAVIVLALLFFLQEAWLRRPKPVFTWVRGLLVLMLLTVIGHGIMKTYADYEMHEFVSVSVKGEPSRIEWGEMHLNYSGACIWSNKKWLPVEKLPELQEASREDGYTFVGGEHIYNVWPFPGAPLGPYIEEGSAPQPASTNATSSQQPTASSQ